MFRPNDSWPCSFPFFTSFYSTTFFCLFVFCCLRLGRFCVLCSVQYLLFLRGWPSCVCPSFPLLCLSTMKLPKKLPPLISDQLPMVGKIPKTLLTKNNQTNLKTPDTGHTSAKKGDSQAVDGPCSHGCYGAEKSGDSSLCLHISLVPSLCHS